MFMYLVALAATIFIIFGLAYAKPSSDWLRSSIQYPLFLYNHFNQESLAGETTNNANFTSSLPSGRSFSEISERTEYEGFSPLAQRTSNERLPDEIVRDGGSKLRKIPFPRYSLENVLQDETDNDSTLAARIRQPVVLQNDFVRTSKQEENKENILQALRASIQKTAVPPPTRLNTREMYDLLLKETRKEREAQPKLLEIDESQHDNASSSDEIRK